MKFSEFLITHAIRQGKTHHLASLCRDIGASLIVRDAKEAKRIENEFGIKAYPCRIDADNLRGHSGILYMDPDACGSLLMEKESEIQKLKDNIKKLSEELDYD